MNRRSFLSMTAFASLAATPVGRTLAQTPGAPSALKPLRIVKRTIEVNRRSASVYGLLGPDGRPGLTFTEGEEFRVRLVNESGEPTTVHWHGLTPPWAADGVADAPLPLIGVGETREYGFPVGSAGTHWMHAHTLQEQALLAAPLIVRDRRPADEQEVVVLLHDFSFTPAEELLARLTGGSGHVGMNHGAMGHGVMSPMPAMSEHAGQGAPVSGHAGHGVPAMAMDVNDVEYDAYLANDRTLDDPEVVRLDKGGRVRVRIINGATATGFTIDTGRVEARLVAVDGQPVVPVPGRLFPVTMGQRIDLVLEMPKDDQSVPILALRENAPERTGIILATAGAQVGKLATTGAGKGPLLDLAVERHLRAAAPLAPRAANRTITTELQGTMEGYAWSQSGFDRPAPVRKGERVAITMRNTSMMAHPMHLHGHRFQVIGIDGTQIAGAVRDTVLVTPGSTVTVAFEADNAGTFAFHCHHLYHMAAGMMGFITYDGISG
ncbi:multicopper oxidase family protein [Microvirga sesbaniae]|uniref:multicopper oxidase family protein n=1 Tax=Microvirga sesbaniae TaxID=681392 RepID=UPI00358DC62E